MAAIKFRDFDKPRKCKNCGCEQVSKNGRVRFQQRTMST